MFVYPYLYLAKEISTPPYTPSKSAPFGWSIYQLIVGSSSLVQTLDPLRLQKFEWRLNKTRRTKTILALFKAE